MLNELIIKVETNIASCNIESFKEQSKKYLEGLHSDFETDEDFAIAKIQIKELKDFETQIKDGIESVLNGSADVAKILDDAKEIAESFRKERLLRDSLVKKKEQEIKDGLISDAFGGVQNTIESHDNSIIDALKNKYRNDGVQNRLLDSIKNKRTISSLKAAVNAEKNLVIVEIVAEAQRLNRRLSLIPNDCDHLFSDRTHLIRQSSSDEELKALIDSRIAADVARRSEELRRHEEEIKLREEEARRKAELAKEAEEKHEEADNAKPLDVEAQEPQIKEEPKPEPPTEPVTEVVERPKLSAWSVVINLKEGIDRDQAISIAKEIKERYLDAVDGVKLTNTEQ